MSKRHFGRLLVAAGIISLSTVSVAAQTFNSGSTGADGAFNPTVTTTLTLPPDGVFNFTTVNIPAGVFVTFTKNAANTPVTILTTGDVSIGGIIKVDGQAGGANGIPGRGGPGGFDGGMGGSLTVSLDGTSGLGPGGGGGGVGGALLGSGAGFGTAGSGTLGGPTYGTPTLLPLIGGSGGGAGAGSGNLQGAGGGGGGGAILIASSGTITLAGAGVKITARGGSGASVSIAGNSGGGSGGGIRLIANRIDGTGVIQAQGGIAPSGLAGGVGRVRVEAFDLAFAGASVPPVTAGTPGPVTPPSGSPTLQITAVAGVSPPATPQGSLLAPPDITLSPTVTNPVTVNLAASNIPLGTNVAVTVTPEGASQTTVLSTALGGTQASSTASASVTLPNGVSVISATATFATTTASLGNPMMIGGEEVKWIRVGATYGGNSTLTYITASGKEARLR